MNAVGGGRELYFYHLVDDAGGYRRVVDVVDVLRLLVQIVIEVDEDWLGSVYTYAISHAALVLIIQG